MRKLKFITIEPLSLDKPKLVGNVLFLPRSRFEYLFPEITDSYRFKPKIVCQTRFHAFVSVPVERKGVVTFKIKKINRDLLFLSPQQYAKKLASIVVSR